MDANVVIIFCRDTVRVEQISGFPRRLHLDSGLKRRKLPPSTANIQHPGMLSNFLSNTVSCIFF